MTRLLPLLLALTACKPVLPTSPLVADPAPLVARAQAEPAAAPVYSNFSAILQLPDQSMSLQGTLLVQAPDRFRIELRGPIGPAQVIVTCNGTDATTWIAPQNNFVLLPDANAIFGSLLGAGEGVSGAAAATSLLLGRMPILPGTPTLGASGSVATAAWARADGARFEASVDSRTAHLVGARATDAAGALLLQGEWLPGDFPTTMTVKLPTLGVQADIRYAEWKPAAPDPALFIGVAPPGARIKTLDLSAPQPEP